jgi:hypothetical protein
VDTVTVAINDQGHTGSGGGLIDQKNFNIAVQAPDASYLPLIIKSN